MKLWVKEKALALAMDVEVPRALLLPTWQVIGTPLEGTPQSIIDLITFPGFGGEVIATPVMAGLYSKKQNPAAP